MSYLILNVQHRTAYDPYRTAAEAADAFEDSMISTHATYHRSGNTFEYRAYESMDVRTLTFTDGP